MDRLGQTPNPTSLKGGKGGYFQCTEQHPAGKVQKAHRELCEKTHLLLPAPQRLVGTQNPTHNFLYLCSDTVWLCDGLSHTRSKDPLLLLLQASHGTCDIDLQETLPGTSSSPSILLYLTYPPKSKCKCPTALERRFQYPNMSQQHVLNTCPVPGVALSTGHPLPPLILPVRSVLTSSIDLGKSRAPERGTFQGHAAGKWQRQI